jgi:hypothetical protein
MLIMMGGAGRGATGRLVIQVSWKRRLTKIAGHYLSCLWGRNLAIHFNGGGELITVFRYSLTMSSNYPVFKGPATL